MADDDEIDILGDFSFNSCLAQNDQGIPSCSNREDTVHPQWLLDTTASNWYDSQSTNRIPGPVRKLSGNSSKQKYNYEASTTWTTAEKKLLVKEMSKYGRNIHKISQTITTKTEAEIQAQIDADFGVHLDTPSFGLALDKHGDQDDTPAVVQEEIVTDDAILNMISTGSPIVKIRHKPFRKKVQNKNNSLLKSNVLLKTDLGISSADIVYEDDFIVGSTEYINGMEIISSGVLVPKEKVKAAKKMGNHRRKGSRSYEKAKSRNRELKSPQRQRKDSSQSDGSGKSSKMHIVLGSGQALPLSEGEQVIKIEKKKDSDPESDIDIDVDSDADNEEYSRRKEADNVPETTEERGTEGQRFEPMPKRQKKIKLPPFKVSMHVSALLLMDAHAHTSRGEVMGLLGGSGDVSGGSREVKVTHYKGARAAAARTHCDMDPVSQATAAESLSVRSASVVGWHHSHPAFPCSPSSVDLASQATVQRAGPMLAFITSPHWPTGRTASQYRCFRIEESIAPSEDGTPVGYQFSVQLIPDLRQDNLQAFVQDLQDIRDMQPTDLSVDVARDVCPDAGITYLEKCISSATHHLVSAGYQRDHPVLEAVLKRIKDVFR